MAQYISIRARQSLDDGGKTIVRVATKRPYTTQFIKARTRGRCEWVMIPRQVSLPLPTMLDVPNVFTLAERLSAEHHLQLLADHRGPNLLALEAIKNKYLKSPGRWHERRYTVLALVAGVHATAGLIVLAQSQNASPAAATLIRWPRYAARHRRRPFVTQFQSKSSSPTFSMVR